MFGYVAQFIYRYLLLNWDKKLSAFKYFILASSAQTVKMVEMNKQISRNLIIQASMPFFIYLSILFLLGIMLFKIDVSKWDWLQYYNIISSIPMFLPTVLNPIVSICIIQYYRKAFVNGFKRIVKFFKLCGQSVQ
uniref:Serpentine receptor class gamma n=1 Tax=Globodera pallida TaxID=36090 RepID=A0A183BJ88_GLOPA